jgi:hypothetical protein
MHLLMLWHSMASAELISAKPLLALVGVVIGVAGPFDHPGSWEQPGMHLLMFWHNMLTPMAPMGTGRDAYCARTSVTHSATHLLRVSPIFVEGENSFIHSYVYNSTHWRIHVHSSGVRNQAQQRHQDPGPYQPFPHTRVSAWHWPAWRSRHVLEEVKTMAVGT